MGKKRACPVSPGKAASFPSLGVYASSAQPPAGVANAGRTGKHILYMDSSVRPTGIPRRPCLSYIDLPARLPTPGWFLAWEQQSNYSVNVRNFSGVLSCMYLMHSRVFLICCVTALIVPFSSTCRFGSAAKEKRNTRKKETRKPRGGGNVSSIMAVAFFAFFTFGALGVRDCLQGNP